MKVFDECDVVLIINTNLIDVNFFKLSKLLEGGLFEYSALILTRDNRKIVITSPLEERSAKKGDLEVVTYNRYDELFKKIREMVNGYRRIGLNCSFVSYNTYKKLQDILNDFEIVDISEKLKEIRMIKEEYEIKNILEAARIASEVAENIPDFVTEGMTEKQLAAKIIYNLQNSGANSISFDPIVAFGENAGEPHYMTGDRKLRKGDVILTDFGAKYNRYCSDITRTYFFGNPPEEFIEAYDVVLTAQKEGIKLIREGIYGHEVDGAVRNIIDSSKFRGRFVHSTGHGIGLETHDHSALSSSSSVRLLENMVVTVEPGIYTESFGIRIEDMVVVKKTHGEVITSAPKDLITI